MMANAVAAGRGDAARAVAWDPAAPRRAGALSATLLGLAAGGGAPEPVHRLLGAGRRGSGSGPSPTSRGSARPRRAIAAGIALAARSLAGGGLGR